MMQNNNQRSAEALRALLDANICVLGDMDDDGRNMRIQNGKANYASSATPFFSSVEVLRQSVDSSRSYLSMPARTLFELLPNTDFLLNPRSIDRQEFSRALVQQLLSGSYFAAVQTPPSATQQGAQTMAAKFKSILSLRKN